MKSTARFLAYPTALFLLLTVCLAKEEQRDEANTLIASAIAASTVRSPGAPPFRLTAHIRFQTPSGQQEGQYLLIWLSPAKWREALTLPGYSELTVGGEGKAWFYRNLRYVPLRAMQAKQALSFESRLFLRPEQKVRKIRKVKQKGVEVRCLELEPERSSWRQLCVNPTDGTVARIENTFQDVRYEYSNPVSFGAKLQPGSIAVVDRGQKVVEIEVKELTSIPGADDSLFVPPQQAAERPWCEEKNVTPARLADKVFPRYPNLAKVNRESGIVSIYALLGVNGRLKDLAVVRTAGSNLDQAALEGVSQWRYEPFLCGSVPIEKEILINVNFELRP